MRIRTALVLAALLTAGLAGCGHKSSGNGVASVNGGGANPTASPSDSRTDQQKMLEYAQCMRDNGVTNFPDPQIDGQGHAGFSIPQGVDRSVVDAAQQKCQHLMPGGGDTGHADPQALAQMRAYAQCMRDHGVTNFPDPDNGGLRVDGQSLGMTPDDPTYQAADRACQPLMGSAPAHTLGTQG
jgi:hypothetical protein